MATLGKMSEHIDSLTLSKPKLCAGSTATISKA